MAGVERVLIAMAVLMAIQTALCLGAAVAAYAAWRRATRIIEETRASLDEQASHLRTRLDRLVETVDETADAVRRGSDAVGDVVTDVRQVVHNVRDSVGSVASVVSAPRAAVAFGLWRGIQMLRKRRSPRDPDTIVASPR